MGREDRQLRKRVVIVAVLILAGSFIAFAEDRRPLRSGEFGSRPIEITAVRLFADSVLNSVTFEGSVIARQDDVTLFSDRLFAEYSKGTGVIEKIIADGNVRVVQKDREGRSPHAEFYNMEQRIVLMGGADVIQGGNTVRGETATIYLRENRSVVSGGEGGRVKAVIQPKGQMEIKGKDGQ